LLHDVNTPFRKFPKKVFPSGFYQFRADEVGMKLDFDLLREILLYAENRPKGCDKNEVAIQTKDLPDVYHGISPDTLKEHVAVLVDAEVIYATSMLATYSIGGLKMHIGHFLDNAKVSEAWDAAKRIAGNKSFEEFRSILHQLVAAHEGETLAEAERLLSGGGGS